LVAVGTVGGVTAVLLLNPQGLDLAASSGVKSGQPVGTSGTATGDAIFVRYGYVQLTVTVESGRITAIVPVQIPGGDGRSAEISRTVVPLLREQALTVQSAAIDGVSGATFTSYGYAQSLQSALDKLGP
jgi:uncharacterized protein with FMN-binding domain